MSRVRSQRQRVWRRFRIVKHITRHVHEGVHLVQLRHRLHWFRGTYGTVFGAVPVPGRPALADGAVLQWRVVLDLDGWRLNRMLEGGGCSWVRQRGIVEVSTGAVALEMSC